MTDRWASVFSVPTWILRTTIQREGKLGEILSTIRKDRLHKAGWVARTRPLSEPLSPRGPQPVLSTLRGCFVPPNGTLEPKLGYRGLSTTPHRQIVENAQLTYEA